MRRLVLAATLSALLAAPALAGGPYTVKLARQLTPPEGVVPVGATCTLLQIVHLQGADDYAKVRCQALGPSSTAGETFTLVTDVLVSDLSVVQTPSP